MSSSQHFCNLCRIPCGLHHSWIFDYGQTITIFGSVNYSFWSRIVLHLANSRYIASKSVFRVRVTFIRIRILPRSGSFKLYNIYICFSKFWVTVRKLQFMIELRGFFLYSLSINNVIFQTLVTVLDIKWLKKL